MPVAIITGASKGLGRALGAALAERGWDLVLDARTAEVLKESAAELSAYGTRVEALPGMSRTPGTGPTWWRRRGGWAGSICW